ncbi:MAG: hypothetical protein IJO27_05490 [Bacilli bacterium]|nr:hypothetical protein [Bacilli bacterium]
MNNNGCRYDSIAKSKEKHQNEFYENVHTSNKSKLISLISLITFSVIFIFGIFDTIFLFCFKINNPVLSIIVWLIIAFIITYSLQYILYIIKNKKDL